MKGQTLIEVLVALTIAAIVIAAVTSTVLTSLSTEQFNQNQSIADQFAQEGMDIALQNIDLGTGTYCLDQGYYIPMSRYGPCTANINPNYIQAPNGAKTMVRTIIYANTCPQGLMRVTVSVAWNDSKCATSYCHQAKEETCH